MHHSNGGGGQPASTADDEFTVKPRSVTAAAFGNGPKAAPLGCPGRALAGLR